MNDNNDFVTFVFIVLFGVLQRQYTIKCSHGLMFTVYILHAWIKDTYSSEATSTKYIVPTHVAAHVNISPVSCEPTLQIRDDRA